MIFMIFCLCFFLQSRVNTYAYNNKMLHYKCHVRILSQKSSLISNSLRRTFLIWKININWNLKKMILFVFLYERYFNDLYNYLPSRPFYNFLDSNNPLNASTYHDCTAQLLIYKLHRFFFLFLPAFQEGNALLKIWRTRFHFYWDFWIDTINLCFLLI